MTVNQDSRVADTAGASHDFSGWPTWMQNMMRLLALRPQFVLSGNLRDVHLAPLEDSFMLVALRDFLWEALSLRGFSYLLVYDRVDGLKVFPDTPTNRTKARDELGETIADDAPVMPLPALGQLIRKLPAARSRVALLIDYASHLVGRPEDPQDPERDFFLAALKQGHTSHPTVVPGETGSPIYNPVIWLAKNETHLPSWLIVGNESVHCQTIPQPDAETREAAARVLATSMKDYNPELPQQVAEFARTFADLTNGMSLRSLLSVSQLAQSQGLPMTEVDDAVRCYKVGVIENPWKKGRLKEKVSSAAETISKKIKGQERAVTKVVDILMRSVMGLTGAHASASSSRPKGILFFAGPTGTGKTEMAKIITELIFGDSRAYIRFDMSEFSAEHSDARLIGAPPGYVGYETGGELTKAIREKPFSVVLFDEIEKAHPRILDKFLQVLDDGRLTDGRGETVYFTESVIIFTSNLGIYVEGPDGRRYQNVTAEEGYDAVEHKVRTAISDYFKFKLCRPELLNRFGDNIVVFDFISPVTAAEIFDNMLKTVVARVKEENAIDLIVPDEIKARIKAMCITDLGNGGRGIGNRIESVLTNPLARALFACSETQRAATIIDLREGPKGFEIVLG